MKKYIGKLIRLVKDFGFIVATNRTVVLLVHYQCNSGYGVFESRFIGLTIKKWVRACCKYLKKYWLLGVINLDGKISVLPLYNAHTHYLELIL